MIAALCIALLMGVLAGIAGHAWFLAGQALLIRRFVAELLAVATLFALILWGVPLAGLAFGIAEP